MIKLSLKEWRFIGLIWVFVVVLVFTPAIVGIVAAPQDSIF